MEAETTGVRAVRLGCWQDSPGLEWAWRDLLERTPGHSIFQTYAWHDCWWKVFGESHELRLILAYAGPRLIGIAPLMISRQNAFPGRARRCARFIGSENAASDYCDFIVDREFPQALDALLEELCADAGAGDRIDLSHLPAHSPNRAGILAFLQRRGMRARADFQMDAPVRLLGDRQADLKAANKSSLKRHAAYFRKSGELRFHRCAGEEEIFGYLERFFEQHRARWAQAGSPSQFCDPAQRRFFAELVRALGPRGWLRFDVVLFNGEPLAFHFGFEYRRCFIWYKPSFDIRYASRSPGEVLIKFLLERAIEGSLEEFDFTVGAEAFKFRFANRIRRVDRLVAFGSAGDYWAHRVTHDGRSLLRKLLRRAAAPRAS